MEKNKTLHLLYKQLGETPNQCLTRFKMANPDYLDTPMTYAGRLDPLAEGLLLVVSGGEILEKNKYLDLSKEYEFEMLWGFETDTLDILGLVSSDDISIPTTLEVKKRLSESLGSFDQKYPIFSSKPVNGKPLFLWAKEGKINEIEIPSHTVEVFEVSHLERRAIKGNDLLNQVKDKIKSVVGDFRQKEILNKWMDLLINNSDKEFIIDKIILKSSGGFYVRQFVKDLSKYFDGCATTFHIKRNKVGDFDVKDAI